jgi:hypothetical protein
MNNIILDDPQTSASAFLQFINGPSTTKKYVTKGAGGFGWEIENNDTTPYTSITPQGTLVKYTKIFLKIVPIHPRSGRGFGSTRVSTTPVDDFITERDTQTTLFKRSNVQLDPICPPVVFSSILTNAQGQQLLYTLNPHSINPPTSMDFKNEPEVQMGIIAMGYTTNYITLWSILNRNTGIPSLVRKTQTDSVSFTMITRYKYMAAHRLIQLYDMGYLHGDFSLPNIVIDTTHTYPNTHGTSEGSSPGHVLLIDFGATFKHNIPPDTAVSRVDKLRYMIDTKVPYLGGLAPKNHNNYKWLKILIEDEVPSDIENIMINIEANVERYNEEMYETIRRTSPEIIAHIEKYNNSPSTISTVRGGMRRKNRKRVKRTKRASISRKKKRRKTHRALKRR